MKAIEIFWLVAASILTILMIIRWDSLTTNERVLMIVSVVIATFMYSFRKYSNFKN